ncbi:MAG: DUF2946 family protein [Parvibaculaceae bacterium]
MLCALRQRSSPYGLLLALLLALTLGLHADLAARMAPAGHHTAAMDDPMPGHAHHGPHQRSDEKALMKTCAGYCSIVGVSIELTFLPSPPAVAAVPLVAATAAPFQPRPAAPPPRFT